MGRRGQRKPWSGDLGGPLEYRALISPRVGRENCPLPPGGGNPRGSSRGNGNPADASGAFRPDPRVSTKVVIKFPQSAKGICIFEFGIFLWGGR